MPKPAFAEVVDPCAARSRGVAGSARVNRALAGRDGDEVVCAMSDGGQLVDPLAGRLAAAAEQDGGRGLLLHQLADLVRTHTSGTGTTVHAHVRLVAGACTV